MSILLYFSLLILSFTQDCKPFGTRIQYGNSLYISNSTEKMVVSFNTHDPCSSSFLRILSDEGFREVLCPPIEIKTSESMAYYTTYVHRCSIEDEINFGRKLLYNVFGWEPSSMEEPTMWVEHWVSLTPVDPHEEDDPINILVLGDWGPIRDKYFIPIFDSLKKVRESIKLDLFIVLGDIGYDLDSYNGTYY